MKEEGGGSLRKSKFLIYVIKEGEKIEGKKKKRGNALSRCHDSVARGMGEGKKADHLPFGGTKKGRWPQLSNRCFCSVEKFVKPKGKEGEERREILGRGGKKG